MARYGDGRTALEAKFDSVYGLDAGKLISARFRISTQWLTKVVRTGTASPSAIASLALMAALFESPASLRTALQYQTNTSENRQEIEARRLKRHDAQKNNDAAPGDDNDSHRTQRRRSQPLALRESLRQYLSRQDAIDDARFYDAIREQVTLQMSGAAEPQRMSKVYLTLKCSRTASHISDNGERYPSSSALLRRSEESSDAWKKRRLKLILKNADKLRSRQGLITYARESTRLRLDETLKIIEQDEELQHLLVFS
ncbi:hypothetical protein [Paraburkholderia ribeironis]|nr:hypothetical protein [Paraburkholderia ribeironis]